MKIATSAESQEKGAAIKPELLAPAGSFDKMVAAIHYGADAIYCGGKQYSLRARATNFTEKELQDVVNYAHQHGVKVYVAVNIFAHENDLRALDEYLLYLRDIAIDGLIISDPGIFIEARRVVPEMPLHVSTQANVTNSAAALFWHDQGAARINLARELSLAEIAAIKQKFLAAGKDIDIEVFVHGALCISYSGRCLMSMYLTGRDANRGECAHPCRYRYTLLEEKRPGQYFPVEEDERGTYIFNSKDLCLLQQLPALIKAGVSSFKIEGRMKSPYYVGSVVRVYRAAIDYLWNQDENLSAVSLPREFAEELTMVGTRGDTENFISGPPTAESMIYNTPRISQIYVPAGIVRNVTVQEDSRSQQVEIEFRNPAQKGEVLEFLGKDMNSFAFVIKEFRNQDGELVERANSGDCLQVLTAPASVGWQANGLIRKKMA